jgi:hypothetical protein
MYTASITVDTVIDALGDFLEPFVNGAEIIRAQVNRVSMPHLPCVVLTELFHIDLRVPSQDYDEVNDEALLSASNRLDIQVDFYGDSAGDYCRSVETAFRTMWGFDTFPAGIKPLYTSDGIQSPLISGEQQYTPRWTLTVSMQYNPIVSVPQQFADELAATTIAADVLY